MKIIRPRRRLKQLEKNTYQEEISDNTQSRMLPTTYNYMDQTSMGNPDDEDFNCLEDSEEDPEYNTRLRKRATSASSASSTSSLTSTSSCSRRPSLLVANYSLRGNEKKTDSKRKRNRSQSEAEKALGISYISHSKNKTAIRQRCLRPPCSARCQFKCTELIPQEKRQLIFENYWNLGDLHKQREFVANHISVVEYAYKNPKDKSGNNCAFHLPLDDQQIRVCELFFRKTLDLSAKLVTFSSKTTKSEPGDLAPDSNEKNGKKNKIRNDIRQHIKSIPRLEKSSGAGTSKEYIDGNNTVSKLHAEYVNHCKAKGAPYGSCNYGKILTTSQGTQLFEYEGHTFWRTKGNNKFDRWYCSSRKSAGCKVVLKCSGLEVVEKKFDHYHFEPIMVQDMQGRYVKLKRKMF